MYLFDENKGEGRLLTNVTLQEFGINMEHFLEIPIKHNVSEGGYNRFRLVIGKHNPDLYSALNEIQKEEVDTVTAIVGPCHRVKSAQKKIKK